MGAAFAYNSLFAVVPLALAFVSLLTLLSGTQDLLESTYALISESLPPDIALFLNQILRESVAAVEDNRAVIIVFTLLIALWSGSRAVYTVQKALRLVEDPDVEIGYVQMRLTGILVTVGAGVGVMAAYVLLIIGSGVTARVSGAFSISIPYTGFVLVFVATLWIFLLLFAVYRWGAPTPLRRPATTSALVTATLIVGTWAATTLVPSQAAASVAVFGTMGVALLWLYGVGVVVVAGPIAVGSLMRVLDTRKTL
jgi:uncharacterized BrkB/YihY/UPF0761 family membrane protein